MIPLKLNQNRLQYYSEWLALAFAISIPLSTSFTTVGGLALAGCGLLAFKMRNLYRPIGIVIALFILWYGIRAIHTVGSSREIEQSLHKIARLLIIPLLAVLFTNPQWRRNIIVGFVGAVIVSIMVAAKFQVVIFKDNIITSLFCAYCIFILAHLIMDYKKWRWLSVPMVLFLTYYLLFLGMGRSGQVIFFMLMPLFIWQRLRHSMRLSLLAMLALIGVVGVTFVVPSMFLERQKIALSEMQSYSPQHEDQVPHSSSMGVRFVLARNSWHLIKMQPLLGWGTGGFSNAYANYAPEAQFQKETRTNPHNQYLGVWVETGIIGLALLLSTFIILLWTFWRANTFEGNLGVGLVLAYALGCTINSWFWDCATMYFFVLFAAVCLGSTLGSGSQNNIKTT